MRKLHKYLSLAISIQLLLWTISGIYFSFNKIEQIRGEHLRSTDSYVTELDFSTLTLPKAESVEVLSRPSQLIIKIKTNNNEEFFNIDGSKAAPLTRDEAITIVQKKTSLNPLKAEKISNPQRGSEYRGRKLPMYKVTTDHENNVNVYIDEMSGEIVAIRSSSWRLWDLLWGFHIMDYIDRDNFNNFLIKIFSILALISAASGILLFFLSRRKSTS